MHPITGHRSPAARWRRALDPANLVFIIVYLGAYFFLYFNAAGFDIEIQTKRDGFFAIYWAGADQGFDQQRSAKSYLLAGTNRHRFRIPGGRGVERIRLDPGRGLQRLALGNMVFDRTGHRPSAFDSPQRLSGIRAARHIQSLEIRDDHLIMNSSGNDPQLIISVPGTADSVSRLLEFGRLAAAVAVALSVLWGVSQLIRRWPAGYRLIAAGAWLAGFATLWVPTTSPGRSRYLESLVLALVIAGCVTLLFRAVRAFGMPSRSTFKRKEVPLVGAFLAVVLYLALSQAPLLLSVSRFPETLESPSKFERFFQRFFVHRDEFVYLNSLVKIFGFGYSPTTKALLGKDGFFFEGYGDRKVEKGVVRSFDNVTDYMGLLPFNDADLEQWKITLEERQAWLAQRGIRYLFVVAPTKGLIYPEHLPERIQRTKAELGLASRYDQLVAYLKTHSTVPVVDLKTALLAAKDRRDYPLLYYKTDFHWNFYGAFLAYQAIVSGIDEAFPELGLDALPLEEFEMRIDQHWSHRNFLTMLGLKPENHRTEHYIKFLPKPGTRLARAPAIPEDGIYDVYRPARLLSDGRGNTMKVDLIENSDGRLASLLVLGDSFIEKTLLFFSAHSRRTLFSRAVFHFPTGIYKFEQPDIVIQEVLNMYVLRDPPVNPPRVRQALNQRSGAAAIR